MTSLDRATRIRDTALGAVADRIAELGPDYHPACIPIVAANVAMASMADQLLDDLELPGALVVGHVARLCRPQQVDEQVPQTGPFRVGDRVRLSGLADKWGTVEKVYSGTDTGGAPGEVLVAWDHDDVLIESASDLRYGRIVGDGERS